MGTCLVPCSFCSQEYIHLFTPHQSYTFSAAAPCQAIFYLLERSRWTATRNVLARGKHIINMHMISRHFCFRWWVQWRKIKPGLRWGKDRVRNFESRQWRPSWVDDVWGEHRWKWAMHDVDSGIASAKAPRHRCRVYQELQEDQEYRDLRWALDRDPGQIRGHHAVLVKGQPLDHQPPHSFNSCTVFHLMGLLECTPFPLMVMY